MDPPQFVLKTTPPRAHRMAVVRPRLDRLWSDVHERALIETQAPGGFGKSTLLVQWRRRWLERGALVAWVTLDEEDTPDRFAGALALAMRIASGRGEFDRIGSELAGDPRRALDALTAILSEIANLATPTVVMLDDGERLPRETTESALSYLVMNAPANLTVVLGSRVPLDLPTTELAAQGQHGLVTVDDLRLDLDESISLLQKRFAKRMELDDCVRLHEMTEGWPIGLQLAAAAIERAPHYHLAIQSLSARHGDLERYFIESLLDRLPAPVTQFLTRVAILDPLSPELCEATTGAESARAWLDQIMADTPILTVAELRGWMRLHALARDFLMSRFEVLPAEERATLHRRAATWLAENGYVAEAVRHASDAGDGPTAQKYAAQSLWTLATSGRVAEARQAIEQLTPETLAGNAELRLVAAWITAFSERVEQSRPVAYEALADPASSPRVAFIAALVAGAIEGCTDRLGSIPPTFARWPVFPAEFDDPVYRVAYTNTLALVELHQGDTRRAHELDDESPAATANRSLLLAFAMARLFSGLAYLNEADPQRAEALLQPALTHAERTQGRRSVVACLHAACLAAALFERNELARAEAMLAHRMDVIERFVFPDAILLGSQTLARLAVAQGDERRALAVLDNLQDLGRTRDIPRFVLVSTSMRLELHAKKGHVETAAALLPELEALAATFEYPEYQPFLAEYRVRRALARAYVALANFDAETAEAELAVAADVAASAKRTRDAMTVQVLRAVAAHRDKSPRALPLMSEALSLAEMRGCLRVAEDAHPEAAAMRSEIASRDTAKPAPVAVAAQSIARATAQKTAAAAGGLLTPKEAEVLRLLAGGHSNKHIAKTMDISDETVKWHLKNLFGKLSAGTRRHAVDRARMMGLIVEESAA
jgi:LuxR family maltose regulon positive regulatory protein